MELRRSSHLHFVRFVKSGMVAKGMNMDTRGRPALTFKEVKEIYNLVDAEDHNQVPRILLRDDLQSSPTKSYVVKEESCNSSLKSGIEVKSEPEAYDFDCNKSCAGRNDDLDDLSFGNMTLKQIKKRCKEKKRKRLNSVGLNEEIGETCSSVQEGDECDLEEPLISLKSKLSKNMKSKRKSFSASSPNAFSITKSEQVNSGEDLLQPIGASPAPIDIKVGVPELGFSECQAIFSNTAVSDFSSSEQADSFVTVSEKGPDSTDVHILETELPHPAKEPQHCSFNEVSYEYRENEKGPDSTNVQILESELPHPAKEPQYCSFNQVSYEYMENNTSNVHIMGCELPHPTKEPQCSSLNEVSYEYMENSEPESDVETSGWEIVKVDSPEIISYDCSDLSDLKQEDYVVHPLHHDVSSEPVPPKMDYSFPSYSLNHEMPGQVNSYSLIPVPDTTVACGVEKESSFYAIEEPPCSVSNGVSYKYMENVVPEFGARFSGLEIVKVNGQEIISYQCSDSQEFEEGSTLYLLPYDVSTESLSPSKDHSPDLKDSRTSNSSEHKMAWQTSDCSQIEVLEMDSNDKLQCMESMNGGVACSYESRIQDLPSNISNISTSPSDNSLYWSPSCLRPQKHSVPFFGDSPSAEKYSLSPASGATNSVGAFNEPTSPGPQDYLPMKQHHHPERLLSSRKVISPTSQERLCRAMESTVLDDNERQKCRGKLHFGKQTNHRILKAQGLDQLRIEETTINPKSIMRKTKQERKGSPPKGILKIHPSRSAHVSTASTIAQRCSQSAIAFSQRQMRDIESLATKLTTELKSMKEIVKVKLHCESSAATATKENADEVRIAVDHASRVEETARKWLSMMARDCNRFCKIMRLTEENTATERVIHKERKITFADEAGGKLCHVKVFKNDIGTASQLECDSEKIEIANKSGGE